MARLVWPEFVLFAAPRDAVMTDEPVVAALLDRLQSFVRKPPEALLSPPMVLRWIPSTLLGLPRAPFTVYRRLPRYELRPLAGAQQVGAGQTLGWGGQPMYLVELEVSSLATAQLAVAAVDQSGEPIPGQRIVFSGPGRGRLRCPQIGGLRFSAPAGLAEVSGLDQRQFANDPRWEPIEAVGLPFEAGAIDPALYAGDPQGGFLTTERDGRQAARDRLDIARILQRPLPPTGNSNLPAPAWPPPDTDQYLDNLVSGNPALLDQIAALLSQSSDQAFGKRQSDQAQRFKLPGLRQLDLPDAQPGDPAVVDVPILALILLAVATDSYAATALGCGTVDVLPDKAPQPPANLLTPPGDAVAAYDYMVTAVFDLPFVGRVELAALSQLRPPPQPPAELSAATLQTNRPPAVDQPASEVVSLSWRSAAQPQSYAVVRADPASGRTAVLNQPYRYTSGFMPFTPNRVRPGDGALPADAIDSFVAPREPLPFNGTIQRRYYVAGHDVFGRWSSFAQTAHNAEALPVLRPGLHLCRLDAQLPAANRASVATILEVQFSWDWSDRRAAQIVFSGGFYAPDAAAIPAFVDHLALQPGETGSTPLVVAFAATGDAPQVVSNHAAVVEELAADSPAGVPSDSPRQRYRLTVRGLRSDFSQAIESRYAVYARAVERMQPGVLSELVGPLSGDLFDPLPPEMPLLAPDLRWTALPDASGRARGVLEWPPSAGAAGYVVWEATEMALRNAIDPDFTPLPAHTSAAERVTQILDLRDATLDGEQRSLSAFTRLNPEPFQATAIEVELPGAANVVYAYRVSAVSATNIDSPRSELIFFAVPRRNLPGTPNLVLRNHEQGAQLIALPGRGIAPLGFKVFRTRNPQLLAEIGLWGPPLIGAADPRWAPHVLAGLHLPDQTGMALIDPLPPSWWPYYYRVVAVSSDRPERGELGGDSSPSAVQRLDRPPLGPPQLAVVRDQQRFAMRVVTFETDLPLQPVAAGAARIALRYRDGGQPVEVTRHPDELPYVAPGIRLSATRLDADRFRLTLIIRGDDTGLVLTARDPLGRVSRWSA